MARFIRSLAAILAMLTPFQLVAQAQERPLTIFAASSIAPLLAGLAKDPDVSLPVARLSQGGSATLARQIEAGAPADIFVSADAEWMDWAMARKLVKPETRRVFASNALVLIAGAGDMNIPAPAPGFPLKAALGTGRLAMGHPESVPAGRYGKQALETLGVWSDVRERIAATENVTAAVTLVARGEAPAGIAYATDVRDLKTVRIVGAFPDGSHAKILYHAAVVSHATHPDAAAYLAGLLSDTARRYAARHGYLPAP